MTNILGGNLHVERERGQGPKLLGTFHLSRGGKAHQGHRATGAFLVGMQNGTATLENGLVISHKVKCILSI